MTQKEFYQSMMWRRCRRDYIDKRIRIDGGLCEVCRQRPGKVVHHIEWLDDVKCNLPEIAINPKNLRYECQDCHNAETDPREERVIGRVSYAEDGSVSPRGEY